MRHEPGRRRFAWALLGILLLGAPALAQHREYYVRGKVTDSDKKPLADVEIRLRDKATSRSYNFRTDKEGVFKFAGLPHGVYQVTFTREGYAPKTDEWKLESPQDRMQRVDFSDVVLVSQARLREFEGKQPAPGRVIIGYVFPRDRAIEPAAIAADKLTHVNYAFINIEKGVVVEGPRDAEHLRALTGLRARHPHFKVLVSVGGWTWSGGFSEAAATAESRARLVASSVEFVRRHDLDGFDVDWEYPGQPGAGNPHGPQDKPNFTSLMAELRAALDQEGKARGRSHLLTMAAGASRRFLEQTEMDRVAGSVDFVNLMTYDFRIAGSDPLAGHHANLYRHPQDDGSSADGAVRDFIAAGIPAHKLVLGVPFYGRAWGGVQGDVSAQGLYQPGGPLAGEAIETGYEKLAAELVGRNGFGRHWDGASQAPYLWNPERRVFISYDDPESLRIKCRYIRDKGLAGAMFWEYYADQSGALLGTLFEELRTNQPAR